MVYPSGGALATVSAPRLVAAPGLFSTTIGWPMRSDIFCPTSRAKKSVPPPAGYGTIRWIGLVGKVCAGALCGEMNAPIATAAAAAARKNDISRSLRAGNGEHDTRMHLP